MQFKKGIFEMNGERIILIQEYLQRNTDKNRSVTIRDIQNELARGGIENVSPITIRHDIDRLSNMGYDISEKKPQKRTTQKMTLQQLKYFTAVAECGNITEAAEKLFIAQPSLTSAIHSLENEMGVIAFIRSNKGVELTRDGEVLLSYARQLLEQADVMTEHFRGGEVFLLLLGHFLGRPFFRFFF